MEQGEYPVPGFDGYTITPNGKVYSYKQRNRKELSTRTRKVRGRIDTTVMLWDGKKPHCKTLSRLILSAKVGRVLEEWEQARHIDGNADNNHMDNLEAGCLVNNAIDDIDNGSRQTDLGNVRLAIRRLKKIKRELAPNFFDTIFRVARGLLLKPVRKIY